MKHFTKTLIFLLISVILVELVPNFSLPENKAYAQETPPDDQQITYDDSEEVSMAFRQGWNLISLPLTPIDADPAKVFDELITPDYNWLAGNLHRYDALGQGYVSYQTVEPKAFGKLYTGEGYWFNAVQDVTIKYEGIYTPQQLTISFDQAGWYMIGTPLNHNFQLDKVQVKDRVSGEVKNFSQATGEGSWLQDPLIFYDNGVSAYRSLTLNPGYLAAGGQNQFLPWQGYWVYVFKAGVDLIFPSSGGLQGYVYDADQYALDGRKDGINRVTVKLSYESDQGPQEQTQETDSTGLYYFPDIDAYDVSIEASMDDYESLGPPLSIRLKPAQDIWADDIFLDFQEPQPDWTWIQGFVQDKQGNYLSGVEVVSSQKDESGNPRATMSDEVQGWFQILISPVEAVALTFSKGNYTIYQAPYSAEPGLGPIPEGKILPEGWQTQEASWIATNVELEQIANPQPEQGRSKIDGYLKGLPVDGQDPVPLSGVLVKDKNDSNISSTTNEQGYFSLTKDGDYTFEITTDPIDGYFIPAPDPIQIRQGEHKGLNLNLTPYEEETTSIEGQVKNKNGDAFADAYLTLGFLNQDENVSESENTERDFRGDYNKTQRYTVKTNSQGKYFIQNIKVGVYPVELVKDNVLYISQEPQRDWVVIEEGQGLIKNADIENLEPANDLLAATGKNSLNQQVAGATSSNPYAGCTKIYTVGEYKTKLGRMLDETTWTWGGRLPQGKLLNEHKNMIWQKLEQSFYYKIIYPKERIDNLRQLASEGYSSALYLVGLWERRNYNPPNQVYCIAQPSFNYTNSKNLQSQWSGLDIEMRDAMMFWAQFFGEAITGNTFEDYVNRLPNYSYYDLKNVWAKESIPYYKTVELDGHQITYTYDLMALLTTCNTETNQCGTGKTDFFSPRTRVPLYRSYFFGTAYDRNSRKVKFEIGEYKRFKNIWNNIKKHTGLTPYEIYQYYWGKPGSFLNYLMSDRESVIRINLALLIASFATRSNVTRIARGLGKLGGFAATEEAGISSAIRVSKWPKLFGQGITAKSHANAFKITARSIESSEQIVFRDNKIINAMRASQAVERAILERGGSVGSKLDITLVKKSPKYAGFYDPRTGKIAAVENYALTDPYGLFAHEIRHKSMGGTLRHLSIQLQGQRDIEETMVSFLGNRDLLFIIDNPGLFPGLTAQEIAQAELALQFFDYPAFRTPIFDFRNRLVELVNKNNARFVHITGRPAPPGLSTMQYGEYIDEMLIKVANSKPLSWKVLDGVTGTSGFTRDFKGLLKSYRTQWREKVALEKRINDPRLSMETRAQKRIYLAEKERQIEILNQRSQDLMKKIR